MVGQIQRDLDKSQNDQKELQAKLKVAEERTAQELAATKQQYETSQRAELDRQKRELMEQHQTQVVSARTETERAVLQMQESVLANTLAEHERRATQRIREAQQAIEDKLTSERHQSSSEKIGRAHV